MDSYFGATDYLADQHSAYANLLYQNVINDSHKFTLGLNGTFDRYNEDFLRKYWMLAVQQQGWNGKTDLANAGVFGEYTYHAGEKFSAIAGLRGDWFSGQGFKVSPRVTLKYMPVDEIVLRANGGRGLRYSTPLVDNIGVFSTGKEFVGAYDQHILEDAWTVGGNITYYMPFGASSNTYISLDYFRTQFAQQMVVDYECNNDPTKIHFYALNGKRSYTDNFQVDFSVDPIERFNVTATFRYTNARVELEGRGLVEKPMTSQYKGVLNLQYATNLNRWIFDFTASVNGPCRVYDFMRDMDGIKERNGNYYSPVYPLLYAQITRRFKGWDVYVGAENLTNFRQKDVLVGVKGADGLVNPRMSSFDASCIWGPLMGIKAHIGFRFTLWKKA
jgi:outer membrane receptor for ferrienterochelin and colicin